MRLCRTCGEPLPRRKIGSPGRLRQFCVPCGKARNKANVQRHLKRYRQEGHLMRRRMQGVLIEHDDLPSSEIERLLAAAERAVRGTFTVDPWQQKQAWDYER